MKKTLLFAFAFFSFLSHAQEIEKITIPKGVVYNYTSVKTLEKAKKLLADNLSNKPDYKIVQDHLIIGPALWKRYKDNESLKKIEGRKIEFHVDNLILEGKTSQNLDESKIIWDEFKNEVANDYKIRKATPEELNYYWSVISFDIEEPLLIVETKEHNYILNLLNKNLKLLWLDEAPRSGTVHNLTNSPVVMYQNGEVIDTLSKGIKETKLEKLILLNSDQEIVENSSEEDINLIIEKTSKIFEQLFKDSQKSGKILVEIELKKKKNEIHYAVKDDLDLDIMKVFEQKINAEVYPNSRKNPIKLQLIFKVNSFNDTE
ncbi:hypothetical protein HNP37_003077 [Flavobacterium nitrogenifigens]|uniref:Uncharacterized protein n=2 Tax=Flavobacterium TaxID=237 RepID=A0A7W7IYR7_9FLAO|nr:MULTISPECIES: hypothetical protein [Flavobacterium]MBB4803002.1 hypothetical protein [Flavobacterium nitrogenifigens]MBB6387960.1 hypothetical protein [Flavobacterium notoginsengisoli]